ncbi:hypothetical protein F5887DRAFT_68863, partial [Amanita rubescens]
MAELQKEVDALRSKPDLASALVELEERNNEMEELLRKKCAEIEENDDKVLEILKDNKKLTAKVESLNRKVQNMQAKLSAAKASIPKPLPQAVEPVLPSLPVASPVTSPTTRSPPIQERSCILSKSTPAAAMNCAASIGATVHRAKTPEARLAHPTVFKAKSPDKQTPSALVSRLEETEQVIGKKRRAPEDFEACDSLPPQGFTIDSVPDDRNENRTPRVRRMLSGGLSGFTPVRRTYASQSSPKRPPAGATKTSLISDVTNSPSGSVQERVAKEVGWVRSEEPPHIPQPEPRAQERPLRGMKISRESIGIAAHLVSLGSCTIRLTIYHSPLYSRSHFDTISVISIFTP